MNPQQNVSLANYSTMRLGGPARYLTTVSTRSELSQAVEWAKGQGLPVIAIGGGSNIVWKDEGFPGLVIVNKITRFELFDEDGRNVYLTAGAGENWDSVVGQSASSGLTGIEALSLIPGSTGATPIQNVGAYGQEISQTLTTVEAYDSQTQEFVNIPAMDCAFGYRTSRFKTTDRGRFFISGITLHLMRGLPEPPYYSQVADYLHQHGIERPTPQDLRDVVIAIRQAKLPDPAEVANCGSFFANPIVPHIIVNQLLEEYPTLSYWPLESGEAKISAAWLVDQAGFNNFHDDETGMRTWPAQALVFVNDHAKTTADLLKFKQKVIDGVQAKFGITLVQEPELLP